MAEEKKTKKVAEMPEEEVKVEKPKEERVRYTLPRNVLTDSKQKHKTVIINGKVYQVQVGVPVDVPKAVAEVLDSAIAAKYAAEDLMSSLAEEHKGNEIN